jgi:uncharacterized delta-60 repeat protein
MKFRTNKQAIIILQLLLLILSGLFAIRGAGEVDPTFNASASGFDAADIFVIKKQSDGKFLIGGNFTHFNGKTACGIARINADGSPDTAFNPPDFGNCLPGLSAVAAIGVQSDGKIIVGGAGLSNVNGDSQGQKVYRFNADGSWDSSFQSPVLVGDPNFVRIEDIEVQADDKILIGGQFQLATQGSGQRLTRLNANGTLDTAFANFSTVGVVWDIEIEPDGQILTVGETGLVRRNADGSVDTGFTATSVNFYSVKVLPDGKILAGGFFSTIQGFPVSNIARFNADGTVDTTFFSSNTSNSGIIYEILPLPDGKIMIAGSFTFHAGIARNKIARLNSDGSPDVSFQNNTAFSGNTVGTALGLFPDGKILFGASSFPFRTNPLLVRFNTDGSLDTSINFVAAQIGSVREIVQQPDGKILIAGEFGYVNNVVRSSLARLNTDGSLDTSFVPYFNVEGANYNIRAVAVQPDGKIIIGSNGALALKRLNPDGSLDATFNPPNPQSIFVFDIAVLANGQILVGGEVPVNGVSRSLVKFNPDGSLDPTFTPVEANNSVRKIKIQPDGKILIIGRFTQVAATPRSYIARLNADGSLDTTFDLFGGINNEITNLDLQSNGKIVITGHFTSVGGNPNQQRIGRLNPNGSVDSTFSQATDGVVYGLKVQPDDKILVGGIFSVVSGGAPRIGFARLNPDGTVDTGFNVPVPIGVTEIQLQTDGKILIGGDFIRVNGFGRVHIARLLNNIAPARTPFDYDGDGKADISVFRPSENKWYILQSSNYALRENVFGLAGDVPVPADFDGDGKTDVAIFRPSAGAWWYLSSISGTQVNVNLGQAGDIPRPSDVDGDGKTDFVVYRPSNSVWYRLTANGVSSSIAFGIAEDKPLIGDFDGDGKSEPAVFRPSTGDWWYTTSVPGQFAVVHWGAAGDIPVPADVDADGKTDFVVYRPSNGGWYILRSGEQNYTILQFGTAEDKPVMADYDGDGKADVAVFRPSTGTWYLLQTTAGFGAVQWGMAGDIPTENAFLP